MRVVTLLCLVALRTPLAAQEFVPPDGGGSSSSPIRLGLFGFGSRLGVDFFGGGQAILSPTLEIADIFTDRIRLRPSAEVGMGDTVATYVVNLEVMARFTPDASMVVPYVGGGIALATQQRCGRAVDCPDLWAQVAVGFEVPFAAPFNWLIEYHGEKGLDRHRFFIGLTTRRGS